MPKSDPDKRKPTSQWACQHADTGDNTMNTCIKLALALLIANPVSLAGIGHAGEENLTDLQNAKVAHQIAKQRMLESRKTKEEREQSDSEDQSCGSIDIGNVRTERGAGAPREIITVVKGDVINTGRCR